LAPFSGCSWGQTSSRTQYSDESDREGRRAWGAVHKTGGRRADSVMRTWVEHMLAGAGRAGCWLRAGHSGHRKIYSGDAGRLGERRPRWPAESPRSSAFCDTGAGRAQRTGLSSPWVLETGRRRDKDGFEEGAGPGREPGIRARGGDAPPSGVYGLRKACVQRLGARTGRAVQEGAGRTSASSARWATSRSLGARASHRAGRCPS
jgi:hypothetical protein